MSKWAKRAIRVAAVALLLAADTLITAKLVSRGEVRAAGAPVINESPADPMASFRLSREQLRARQEAQLNDLIHAGGTDTQAVAEAQRQLTDMLAHARAENAIEGILQSRGFEDALASVSDASANVLIRREALGSRESAVILDLVMRETGLTGGSVKIIPVK